MVPSAVKRHTFLTPASRDALIILTCVAAHVLYLVMTYLHHGYLGFPLDDAWIYQVYARNLANSGQWAFVPGVPSTGSTSILWTLLISPAHLFHIDPLWWTNLLGLLSLIATSLGGARLFEEDAPVKTLAVGLAIALEWHLVWAAASGMETGLFSAMLMWFWVWLKRRDPAYLGHCMQDGLVLGLWGGGLLLARPEGVLAVAVAWLYGIVHPGKLAARFRWGLAAGVGFAALLMPFLLLNYGIGGTFWPNTFYAKQTEYASLWSQPYFYRFAEQVVVCLKGAQVLLVPVLLVDLWRRFRRHPVQWVSLLPLAWASAHWALYAARLPVTYQYGRYAIPAVPLVVAYGVGGLLELARPRARQIVIRLASLAWMLASALLFPLFLCVSGAPAYANDVKYIEVEMVTTARWIAAHTAADEVIAAHDIGALGYFAPRRLVDLAGLVSPDVIPFMSDDRRLASYIIGSGADYLIVFPGWSPAYSSLVLRPCFSPVWSAADAEGYVSYSDLLGPMTVYHVLSPEDCSIISP